MHLYEYATIRLVPLVHREEFINLGVVLYCRSQKFLGLRIHVHHERIDALFSNIDHQQLQVQLSGIDKIIKGGEGTIGKLPIAERFRWLTATRSSILQCSKVHPGFAEEASSTLNLLFEELVLPPFG